MPNGDDEHADCGNRCKHCGGELKRFEHRPEDGVRRKDQKRCKINNLPLEDHLCIAECTVVARICTNCHLVNGSDKPEHHPERGNWTKQGGKYIRKEKAK